MRSARRKLKIKRTAQRGRLLGLIIKVFIPLTLILTIFLYLKLSTKYWDGVEKLAFVHQLPNGDAEVIILDPVLSEETTLIIPGDTQVDVARNYGTLRIKNVWQLSQNEHLGGSLLAETVTDSFLFPTNLWSDQNLDNIWKFVFTPGQTNIPFGDRLSAGLFAIKVQSLDKTVIDLGKNQFLKKQTLTDGLPGYVMSGPVGSRLTVYFSDNKFANSNLKFSIIDSTGTGGIADSVGAVLEVLGGKVVAVDKKGKDDSLDCTVLGQNSDAVNKVAYLFTCKKISGKSDFDLEMRIGEVFAKRF